MKRYLIALSALIFMAFAAQAQVPGPPAGDSAMARPFRPGGFSHDRGAMRPMHHRDRRPPITLTDAQKAQMKAINSDYHQQLMALEKHDEITVKQYREKMAALEQARKTKADAVLTQDQKQQIADFRKHQQEMGEKMAENHLMKMKSALNLTEDQVAKIQSQQKESMQKARAIRENTTLTNEQKRQAIHDLMKQNRDNMKSILTADQLKKQQELRDNRMHHPRMRRDNSAS
ncbi:MAG: hypothetical protein KGM98_01210 [Bacteroidota bacterium]|nr:hypothetical protein [Bacteroidota bacterium]